MSNRRVGQIARGALVLAALVLLPLAALLQTPRPVAAQPAPRGSLWVGWDNKKDSFGQVCANPSAASTSSCFTTIDLMGVVPAAMATDGVNVYFAGKNGGVSCPVVAAGGLCIHIMAGGWGGKVKSLAAEGGLIWIGQDDGKIYRCAANIPYASQSTMPSDCVLLDNAGQRSVDSLLLANGRLYAGLGSYGTEQKKQGILWSCDPQTPNACENLDTYGHTTANSLAAGGGYLWAGLDNGIIWRCDPKAQNQCTDWASTDKSVASISYDGQGTLYAALHTDARDGEVWSCSIFTGNATGNTCPVLKNTVEPVSVAAGAGGVFWSTETIDGGGYETTAPANIYVNTTSMTTGSGHPRLLYIPAGGPTGVGGAKITVEAAKNVARKLARGCRNGKNPTGTVVVSYQLQWVDPWDKTTDTTTTFKACDLRKQGVLNWSYGLLDTGDYTVIVTVGKYSGGVEYTIEQGKTKPVDVSVGWWRN